MSKFVGIPQDLPPIVVAALDISSFFLSIQS